MIEQIIGNTVVNFVMNAAIAYGIFRTMPAIPLWGFDSIAGDTIATAFLLPLILTAIVTTITHKKIQNGTLPTSDWRRSSHPLLGKLPQKTWVRDLIFGVSFMAVSTTIAIIFSIRPYL